MTSTLIAILSLTVLGIPIALSVDRNSRGPMIIGTSFLYGSGAMFLVLLTLSIAHIRWTLISVSVTALAIFCAAALIAGRQPATGDRQHPVRPHVLDVFTIVSIAGYALFATLVPLWEWDFWAIWGLKAKVFLEAGAIDWRLLQSHWNTFLHPDYPLLVPLNFDFVALAGGWNDRWLGLLFVAWGLALLLILRAMAAREMTPFYASLLTLGLAGVAVSTNVGLAEGALIAFSSAGVLFVRTGLLDDDAAAWRNGALMLGFAANCKNEGMALLVAVTLAMLAVSWFRGLAVSQENQTSRPRNRPTARLLRLWPAYALAAPWLVLRATRALATDIAGGSALVRLMARLPHAHQILFYLAAKLYKPWFWVAILAGILIAPAAARRREAFVLLVTAIQLVFFAGAYFVTPHDIRWHVQTSWPRLTGQIAVPIAFVVFLMLANSLRGGEDAPHDEATRPAVPARSDQ
ncbi:MAG TPA: hypothetical protein VN380_10100 [Thermoanaerobaculia bacterium]|jgi:hypothetical protein|nr:hypothetical protein [Thermoanaerobaculia bacterium]